MSTVGPFTMLRPAVHDRSCCITFVEAVYKRLHENMPTFPVYVSLGPQEKKGPEAGGPLTELTVVSKFTLAEYDEMARDEHYKDGEEKQYSHQLDVYKILKNGTILHWISCTNLTWEAFDQLRPGEGGVRIFP